MIKLDYPDIVTTIKNHIVDNRTESASFLIWYLENYYRLDSLEAIDAVCDNRGDKGIDGIYVNENESVIEIFQCKISQDSASTIGDTSLKEFFGTLSQFENRKSIESLINSGGNADVVSLIKRLNLVSKIEEFEVKGIFISNINLDSNGASYLENKPRITFIGKTRLMETFISDERLHSVSGKFSFDITGFTISKYFGGTDTMSLIAPIKASELVSLKGINNQSIFAYNVRGPLGKTQVNKDIVNSIREKSLHKNFPLFHNGITIICEKMRDTKDKIEIEDYYVVNGCQSLTSLYENKDYITDSLRILTRFIRINVSSPLSGIITKYSNNQNGVKARDFKSNNPIQIRLQNEFKKHYGDKYFYTIKRGEPIGRLEEISNELAGIYLWSFDLKEPWDTHRKYQVFEDKYADLFGRPEVTAHRILMLHLLMEVMASHIDDIDNKLFGKYALAQLTILYLLRLIFEKDNKGIELLKSPENFVKDLNNRKRLTKCVDNIVKDMLVDINAEINQYGNDFDYKDKLRNYEWVIKLTKDIFSNYTKLVNRGRLDSFCKDWESLEKTRKLKKTKQRERQRS